MIPSVSIYLQGLFTDVCICHFSCNIMCIFMAVLMYTYMYVFCNSHLYECSGLLMIMLLSLPFNTGKSYYSDSAKPTSSIGKWTGSLLNTSQDNKYFVQI